MKIVNKGIKVRIYPNKKQRELYDMRANSLRDKISELNAAERKGIEKGKEEGRKEEKIKNLNCQVMITSRYFKRRKSGCLPS